MLEKITIDSMENNSSFLFFFFSFLQACRKQLCRGKVPALCVVIDSIDFQGADASVVFKDLTGMLQQ